MKTKHQLFERALKYPTNILHFSKQQDRGFHPTQKPVALLEYLIKTYSDKGDVILDFAMGSGSTGVAALNLGREFIGIEQNKKYFDTALKRLKAAESFRSLF